MKSELMSKFINWINYDKAGRTFWFILCLMMVFVMGLVLTLIISVEWGVLR